MLVGIPLVGLTPLEPLPYFARLNLLPFYSVPSLHELTITMRLFIVYW